MEEDKLAVRDVMFNGQIGSWRNVLFLQVSIKCESCWGGYQTECTWGGILHLSSTQTGTRLISHTGIPVANQFFPSCNFTGC
jgi:hypothetical protein